MSRMSDLPVIEPRPIEQSLSNSDVLHFHLDFARLPALRLGSLKYRAWLHRGQGEGFTHET